MKDLIEILLKDGLDDILVTGFIDVGKYLKFNPLYDKVYFVCAKKTFEISLDDAGIILSQQIERIEPWFSVDEDDQFAVMSIYNQLFKTENEIDVKKICYQPKSFEPLTLIYSEGDLERTLILEPKNVFGFSFY
ncbi:hypothetical protein [Thorsellia anophelis]|uniref:Uncharacterized protein n=1 Tax=Thorsellia anophelis DSM 18579 TaxID=1123402 RepID=A0A1I0FMG0_9GAMM|nr:hypothetical protein [Thorsellia anophelis]SET59501.1 hypothetical protein SAMN02583745_02823 [Thorsellia anophelis DSM 18579]